MCCPGYSDYGIAGAPSAFARRHHEQVREQVKREMAEANRTASGSTQSSDSTQEFSEKAPNVSSPIIDTKKPSRRSQFGSRLRSMFHQ